MMNADGTDVRQVTHEDGTLTLSAFSSDGGSVLVSASREGDVYRGVRPYGIAVEGGPIRRLTDAFGGAPVMSPDGKRIAFERGGSRWSRRHYRGPDDRDVWIYTISDGTFTRITGWEGNDGQPRWKDTETLMYMSDREGETVNLYELRVGRDESTARRLTDFSGKDVQSFDVSTDASVCVVHTWDTLYTLDVSKRSPDVRAISITAPEDELTDFTIKTVASDVTEAALSPDGQVMAVIAYGDVYVRNIDDGSPTRAGDGFCCARAGYCVVA